jgi:type III secretion protein D
MGGDMLELRILNGLHQGASLSLDTEDLMLGSSLDADIELMDQGIVNRHCAIEYSKTRSQWVLKSLEGDLFSASGKRPIKNLAIQRELVVKLGDIYIGFFAPDDPWDLARYSQMTDLSASPKTAARFSLKNYRVHIALAAVVGSLVTYSIADDGSGDNSDAGINNLHDLATVNPHASDNMKVLENMLRQRGLLHSVTIQQTDNGWALIGHMADDELATVERMVSRFREENPGVELDNQTAPRNRVLPFKIKSVSSGLYAHVLTTDGDRIYVGDSFKGFTLKKIDTDKILFAGATDVELLW